MQENENSLIIACGDPRWKGESPDEDTVMAKYSGEGSSDGERP